MKYSKDYYDKWWKGLNKKPKHSWRDFIWDHFITKKHQKLVNHYLSLSKDKIVAEIGCGDGKYIARMKNAKKAVGIEISKKAVEQANNLHKKPNNEFICSSFENYTPKKKFDIIYLIEVAEHIENFDKKFSKLANMIKSGGLVIITTPNAKNRIDRIRNKVNSSAFKMKYVEYEDPGHVNYFTVKDLKNIFKSNGFILTKKHEFPIIWKSHLAVIGKKL